MAIELWPEWLPDLADLGAAGSPMIRNCVPLTAGSYGPMPTMVPWSTNTLTERAQDSYSIKDADGGTYIFAGDRQKLYQCPPAASGFTDASRLTGGAYATPPV